MHELKSKTKLPELRDIHMLPIENRDEIMKDLWESKEHLLQQNGRAKQYVRAGDSERELNRNNRARPEMTGRCWKTSEITRDGAREK